MKGKEKKSRDTKSQQRIEATHVSHAVREPSIQSQVLQPHTGMVGLLILRRQSEPTNRPSHKSIYSYKKYTEFPVKSRNGAQITMRIRWVEWERCVKMGAHDDDADLSF